IKSIYSHNQCVIKTPLETKKRACVKVPGKGAGQGRVRPGRGRAAAEVKADAIRPTLATGWAARWPGPWRKERGWSRWARGRCAAVPRRAWPERPPGPPGGCRRAAAPAPEWKPDLATGRRAAPG